MATVSQYCKTCILVWVNWRNLWNLLNRIEINFTEDDVKSAWPQWIGLLLEIQWSRQYHECKLDRSSDGMLKFAFLKLDWHVIVF